MRRSNCCFTVTALFAGGAAQSRGIGGRGSEPAHQCGSGGKGFCFAYREYFREMGRRANRAEASRISDALEKRISPWEATNFRRGSRRNQAGKGERKRFGQ
jgi:hypothetical protein